MASLSALSRPRWLASLAPFLWLPGVLVVIAIVYHQWLRPGVITAGDWPYITIAGLADRFPFPSLWNMAAGTGSYDILEGPMFPLQALQGSLALMHVAWPVSERLIWIFPAVIVPCVATYAVSLSLFRRRLAACVSALAVVMNSYVLLLYQGGQFGVAMAYGCMPLVLWAFIRGQNRGTIRRFILTGIVMAIQAMYDIRSTYFTVGVLLVYGLFSIRHVEIPLTRDVAARLLTSAGLPQLAISLVVLGVLQLWWILPALFVRAPALPAGYADVAHVHALSLSNLSNGVSLFHPFWFANNGRIAPVNPVFFAGPVLVFGSLLRRRHCRSTLFLATVALIAVFLVKGDNGPVGGIYDWLFVHVPGFSSFRDASKFYQPLALAYALLLGVTAADAYRLIATGSGTDRHEIIGSRLGSVLVAGTCCVSAVLPAYPALFEQTGGTFVMNPVPVDYVRLNHFIDGQRRFFRVLWVPAQPRFGTSSALHPALDAADPNICCRGAASSTIQSWNWLAAPGALHKLESLSVGYIVVPDGTKNGDYIGRSWAIPETASRAILSAIRTGLPDLREFAVGGIHVFVNSAAYPLIYTASAAGYQTATYASCTISPVCKGGRGVIIGRGVTIRPHSGTVSYSWDESWYNVPVRVTTNPIYLVLQQTYDSNWQAFIVRDNRPASHWSILFLTPLPPTSHTMVNGYANAWIIREPGTYHVVLEYWPQRLVLLGWFVACIALVIYGGFMLARFLRRRSVRSFAHMHMYESQPRSLRLAWRGERHDMKP